MLSLRTLLVQKGLLRFACGCGPSATPSERPLRSLSWISVLLSRPPPRSWLLIQTNTVNLPYLSPHTALYSKRAEQR